MLKSNVVRDADRRYTIFTENHGKVVLLAKGSRRGRSKMSPHMAHFGVVEMMAARGRVSDRLAGASLSRPFGGILKSLPKTFLAQGFLLTVDALTKQELPEKRIFRLLVDFLAELEGMPEPRSPGRGPVFDAAAVKLLEILGIAPEMLRCVICRRDIDGVSDGFIDLARGGLECPACRDRSSTAVTAETIRVMRQMRYGPLSAASGLAMDSRPVREVSVLTDLLLNAYLERRCPALSFLKSVCQDAVLRPAGQAATGARTVLDGNRRELA